MRITLIANKLPPQSAYKRIFELIEKTIFKSLLVYHQIKYRRLGAKLGFSIGSKVFGYGLVIPHYGTIVVGGSNKIGNYAVLHTSTCISDNGKTIGNALYLSTGAKITSPIQLGDNISIGANSLVNKSFPSNLLLVGVPAVSKMESQPWYIRDGQGYSQRVNKVEELRKQIEL